MSSAPASATVVAPEIQSPCILSDDVKHLATHHATIHCGAADGGEPTSALPKADRRRLKKLQKRALSAITDSECSGLLTPLEWLEFQKLYLAEIGTAADNSVGPCLFRRKRKEGNKVEGSHHRDLMAWMMQRIGSDATSSQTVAMPKKKKKRSQSDSSDDPMENPSIPAWASIHNPAAAENLIVLEVAVGGSASMQQLQTSLEAVTGQHKSRQALSLPTKWFQGYVPKTLTDSLWYFSSSGKGSSNKRAKNEDTDKPQDEVIFKTLEAMILPLDQWKKERYPMKMETSDTEKPNDVEWVRTSPVEENPQFIPLEEARTFVERNGFHVEDQQKDDKQLYLGTFFRGSESESIGIVHVYGMDCEMVKTSVGPELARITLVRYESFQDEVLQTKTIIDELVKPYNPVQDYLTQYSGITATMLEPVQTRLEQVQVYLMNLLCPCDILVGHSLENDLMAAHFLHPRVVDTSLVFRHGNQRTKFSLRHLSNYLLKKSIQSGSHCSEEDAQVTLELGIRRAWLGDTFALPNNNDRKSIFPKWNKKKVVGIGPQDWLQAHITNHANGAHAISYDSVEKCMQPVLAWSKGQRKAQIVCCHLNVLNEADTKSIEQFLVDLLLQTAPSTMVILALQEGLGKAREVFTTRRVCQDPRSSVGWTADDEDNWKAALEICRQGLVFWIGSSNSIESNEVKS